MNETPYRARHLLTALATAVALLALPSLAALALADDGPRMLRKEVVVEAPIEEVWDAWTTEEGLKFVSKVSNVELRPGGPYEWFLDLPPDEHGKRGGEDARVLAFLPHEMLAVDWTFPPSIPGLRGRGEKTQVVVFFDDLGDGRVRVRFVQHGWQEGEEWDAGYEYFDRAWSAVLQRLRSALEAAQAPAPAEG